MLSKIDISDKSLPLTQENTNDFIDTAYHSDVVIADFS